jgi:hypothetical protein
MEYPLALSTNSDLYHTMRRWLTIAELPTASQCARHTGAVDKVRHDKGNIISSTRNCNRKGAPDGTPLKNTASTLLWFLPLPERPWG